jgi:hypothetical protein
MLLLCPVFVTDRRAAAAIGDFVDNCDVLGESRHRTEYKQAASDSDDERWTVHGSELSFGILDYGAPRPGVKDSEVTTPEKEGKAARTGTARSIDRKATLDKAMKLFLRALPTST